MLSGKEKRSLRAAANRIKPGILIGREGVTGKVKDFIDQALSNKELVKIKIHVAEREKFLNLAEEVIRVTGTELVQMLGRTILLYKPPPENEEKPESGG